MTCIKTGCLAFVEDYGEYVYGDAFEVASVLLIRVVWRGRLDNPDLRQFGANRHITVTKISEWWEKDLTSMKLVTTLVAAPFQWSNHGYDGVPDLALKKLRVSAPAAEGSPDSAA